MQIPFTKMQGLGNDFVLIDETEKSYSITRELVRKIANRHFGIGCDQVLFIKPSTHPKTDFDYLIYNADGSQVEQCGNGARCVGYYLHLNKKITDKTVRLNTLGGIIEVVLKEKNLLSVNMGTPRFAPAEIPMKFSEQLEKYALSSKNGYTIHFGAVNVGNPHIVIHVANIQEAPVTELGEYLSNHPLFPQGVNVGFMEVLDPSHIRLRVYERGAGETLACGTGACAAAIVGQVQNILGPKVAVRLLGGELKIQWSGPDHSVWMTGPAEIVFTGHWPIPINPI